jgi:hypothetical protein
MMRIFRITCLTLLLFALGPAMAMPAQAQTILCRSTSFLRQATNIAQATIFSTLGRQGKLGPARPAVTSGTTPVKSPGAPPRGATDKVSVSAVSGAVMFSLARSGPTPSRSSPPAGQRAVAGGVPGDFKCTSTTCHRHLPLTSCPAQIR